VQYSAQVSVVAGSPVNVTVFANDNGAEIPGSEISIDVTSNGRTFLIAQSFIANFDAEAALALAFQPSSGSCQLSPNGSGITKPSASLTVVKIQ
jgi:hypothetical protein